MRKLFTFFAAILCAASMWADVAVNGKLPGAFSVSATKQVWFSQGNLQYQASTNTWRFAEHQYDFVGDNEYGNVYENEVKCNNANVSSSYSGWIDLFGWGTSGWNNGNRTAYQPYATSTSPSDYGVENPKRANEALTGDYANGDWGVYNAAQLGADWRTLTGEEWDYVLRTRPNATNLRTLGTVCDIPGFIVLPDGWTADGVTLQMNKYYFSYYNIINASDWAILEAQGAIFLPITGWRNGTEINDLDVYTKYGYYWASTSYYQNQSDCVYFGEGCIYPYTQEPRFRGHAVRLASEVAPPPTIVSAPTAIDGLVYDGSALELVNAGVANNGVMNYSLDNSTWSTDIPTATEAGNYTVYYKAVGNLETYTPTDNTVAVTISLPDPEQLPALSQEYFLPITTPLTAIAAHQGLNTAAGQYALLVDGNKTNKWCSVTNGHGSYAEKGKDILVWKAGQPVILNKYILTTADDTYNFPDRNWKSWRIYGANFSEYASPAADESTEDWTLIEQVVDDNVLQGVSFTDFDFFCTNTTAYQFYKLIIDDIKSSELAYPDNVQQMAEMTTGMRVIATGYHDEYDASAHGITIKMLGNPDGAQIRYGTEAGVYTLDASPAYSEVGSSTVYFQITAPGYNTLTGSADVTIETLAPMNTKPLTFEAMEDGAQVQYTIASGALPTVEYSTNGTTWTEYSAPITLAHAGDRVYFRGNNANYKNSSFYSARFQCTADCYIYGNIMSLVDATSYTTAVELTADYTFSGMFEDNTHIKNHPVKDLVLPATTLSNNCYISMFWGCTGLTRVPELPAMNLANNCYCRMFYNCTGLTSAPAQLPATTLVGYCYQYMFFGCNHLTNAPELPATTLVRNCYESMFSGCTGLTSAPALPATTLAEECYKFMFAGCTNLSSVACYATSRPDENATYFWLSSVATTGTFYAPTNSVFGSNRNGSNIPVGWNVAFLMTGNEDPDNAGVYYSTFFDSANKYALPAGVEAYIVTTVSGDAMQLKKVADAGQTIPAGAGVILKSSVTPFILTLSDDEAVSVEGNRLEGSDISIATPDHCYVLSGHSSDNSVTGVGFYQYTGTLKAHKAYAVISGGVAYAPKKLRFVFNQEQTTTDITNVQSDNVQCTKVIRNGQLIIIRGDKEYNVDGQIVK